MGYGVWGIRDKGWGREMKKQVSLFSYVIFIQYHRASWRGWGGLLVYTTCDTSSLTLFYPLFPSRNAKDYDQDQD